MSGDSPTLSEIYAELREAIEAGVQITVNEARTIYLGLPALAQDPGEEFLTPRNFHLLTLQA